MLCIQKVDKILVVIHCKYNIHFNSDSRCLYYIDPRYKRIIGGEAVIIDQYPWVVGLFSSRYDEHPYCGASLISNRHLITAAHCIEGKLVNEVFIAPHPSLIIKRNVFSQYFNYNLQNRCSSKVCIVI